MVEFRNNSVRSSGITQCFSRMFRKHRFERPQKSRILSKISDRCESKVSGCLKFLNNKKIFITNKSLDNRIKDRKLPFSFSRTKKAQVCRNRPKVNFLAANKKITSVTDNEKIKNLNEEKEGEISTRFH